ncbi:hypothetical protein [Dolichospermum heterosporum]|uniref:Uncharacterized protein n=2 Tax=Dolichospermum TaxID=748770 RepID=A0ABY5LSE6_9CYAN|nr:hypothetical protein [Dolichospermum heterosporum]UUO13483.1 hypothetical protein NG743_15470 [Dolichospermum heterosporum TAC447]
MNSLTILQNIEKHLPLVGDVHTKSPIAYKATRLAVGTVNLVQMAIAESYINGLEVPDAVLRSLFDSCMPIFFKYFPSLLAPYEWVLTETDHTAEGSQELMKIQYDLPQAMLNPMLGD